MMRTTYKEIASKCFRDEAQALLDLIPQLDEQFEQAVDLLYRCQGHVIVTGVGKSGHVGAKIAATLASTGTPAFFINPLDALHGDLGMVTQNDVVLMISNSGNTDELLRFIDFLQERHISIISITGNSQSLMAKNSSFHITAKVEKEACPLNLAPTSSTTAALAMGDAIAITLMEIRQFKTKDFAELHPGGSLGYKLITRVKDVMYRGNFPILSRNMKLSDALIHISNGKLGLGIVTNKEEILGIITDGDIRRAVEGAQSNFFSMTVEQIMTTHPKTIHPEAKLTEIQDMFKKHKIHSLLVTDAQQHLVGIVDYFAIMQ